MLVATLRSWWPTLDIEKATNILELSPTLRRHRYHCSRFHSLKMFLQRHLARLL